VKQKDGKFGIDIRMLFYHTIWEFKEIIDIFFKMKRKKYLCENYSEIVNKFK